MPEGPNTPAVVASTVRIAWSEWPSGYVEWSTQPSRESILIGMAERKFDRAVSAHGNASDAMRFTALEHTIVLLDVTEEILSYEVLVAIFGPKYGVRAIGIGSIGHYQNQMTGRGRLYETSLINPVSWATIHAVKEEKNWESKP